jgi:hypothetical protein
MSPYAAMTMNQFAAVFCKACNRECMAHSICPETQKRHHTWQ